MKSILIPADGRVSFSVVKIAEVLRAFPSNIMNMPGGWFR